MSEQGIIFRLLCYTTLVVTGGCVSAPRDNAAQGRDALGQPVVATHTLSLPFKDDSIQFVRPEGWLIYQQPSQWIPNIYCFNRAAIGQLPLLSVEVDKEPQSHSNSSPDEISEVYLPRDLRKFRHAGICVSRV